MVRWQMSEARRDFSTLVERASRGEWQLVGRRAPAEVVLADAAEIAELLARTDKRMYRAKRSRRRTPGTIRVVANATEDSAGIAARQALGEARSR